MSDQNTTTVPNAVKPAKPAKDPKDTTILIVEDEPMILDSYSEILSGEGGFNVLKAKDGAVGLELLAANKDKIDLMILDLMMPGVDGLMVLEAMQKEKDKYVGNFPIVVLTNLSSDRVIKEAFNRGATGYIMKTEMQPERMVEQVKKFLK